MQTNTQVADDALARLANVIETRLPAQGGDPDSSYVARLLHKGPDAFLKKIGEEATEVVMAAKDVSAGADKAKLVYEVAERRPDFIYRPGRLAFQAQGTYDGSQTGLAVGPGVRPGTTRFVPVGSF